MKPGDKVWWHCNTHVRPVVILETGPFTAGLNMTQVKAYPEETASFDAKANNADLYLSEKEALQAALKFARERVRCLKVHLKQVA